MGAGSTKGTAVVDDDDADIDRFSVASRVNSPERFPKVPKSNNNNNQKSSVRAKIEALYDSDEDNDGSQPAVGENEKKNDDKKKGLFGFSRKKDEETSVFVHDNENGLKQKTDKKETTKSFKFFNFKRDGSKKSEEKDEPLDQEIKDIQRTFDSLGIVGKKFWDDEKKSERKQRQSQSADDIRDLEPMRNRMNQKRRFSKATTNTSQSTRRTSECVGTSSGGSRRPFKYSWEKESDNSSPAKIEEWKYEAVIIDGFDIDKFKKANYEDSLMTANIANRLPNSVLGSSRPGTANGKTDPSESTVYDASEQKLLANIERDYIS